MQRISFDVPLHPPRCRGPFTLPPWRPASQNRTRRKLARERRQYNRGRRMAQRLVRHTSQERRRWYMYPMHSQLLQIALLNAAVSRSP